MPRFSRFSLDNLKTCHPDLVRLFAHVIRHVDCRVVWGYRDQATQDRLHAEGVGLPWPESKHNVRPSQAADVYPYPIDWSDIERFRAFGGFVLGCAATLAIPLRWGGDWDGDWQFRDQRFVDLGHFELVDVRPVSSVRV